MEKHISVNFIGFSSQNIPLLNHLFNKKSEDWSEEDLKKVSRCLHLTFSDAERGAALQNVFGEIKCEDCKKVADSYKP